jgi:hypothetical protein
MFKVNTWNKWYHRQGAAIPLIAQKNMVEVMAKGRGIRAEMLYDTSSLNKVLDKWICNHRCTCKHNIMCGYRRMSFHIRVSVVHHPRTEGWSVKVEILLNVSSRVNSEASPVG